MPARVLGDYVVGESCIRCKYQDCVEACPTDAFREGENMLVIDPDACILCGLCVPECKVGAIYTVSGLTDPIFRLNLLFSKHWPVIEIKGVVPADADRWRGVAGKMKWLSRRAATRG